LRGELFMRDGLRCWRWLRRWTTAAAVHPYLYLFELASKSG